MKSRSGAITTDEFVAETVNRHKLNDLIVEFNDKVWPTIQKKQACRAKLGSTLISTWARPNKKNITVSLSCDTYVYLTLAGPQEGKDGCGIQGMLATYTQMFAMLDDVLKNWTNA